jgi:virginiamycin B lyase
MPVKGIEKDTAHANATRAVSRPAKGRGVLVALLTVVAALTAATAQAAGPPIVTSTSFTGVGDTSATLKGAVDPNGIRTTARFAYLTEAEYEASGFSSAQTTPPVTLQATVVGTGNLVSGSKTVTGAEASVGTFAPGQEVKGTGIPAATKITAVDTDSISGKLQLTLSNAATSTATGVELKATGPQPIEAQVTGLSPQTVYRFHLLAENTKAESTTGPDRIFATFASPPTFGPCPNDTFRTGALAPPSHPSALLPDCRAYERATPLDKGGGDAQAALGFIKAAAQGGAVTFMSTFGVPGGLGAQGLPLYLASRGEGEWSTRGLLPPAPTGEKAMVAGWSPDMSRVYTRAVRLGNPRTSALLLQVDGGAPVQITPYAPDADYSYVGSTPDNSVVVFESNAALPPEEGAETIPGARQGASNLYAWERESGRLSLVGVMNDGTSPAKGTFGGPYEWTQGITVKSLRQGGSSAGFYTQDERAVSSDGSVFFTEVGTGQLYQRLNPTQPQSALDGQGRCTEAAKACTIHVSATEKENGQGEGGSDAAGPQPAAFMAASSDGGEAFFASPEKLTDDANTGPEQSPARIERDDLAGGAIEKPTFIPQHAIGVTVDSQYVYWADPQLGTIGRAELDGENVEAEFIEIDSIECEIEEEPGVFEEVAARPRYVAVDSEHVYWTNTGCSNAIGPINGTGLIGRADVEGTPASVEPEFITGVSNPQGIAVNSEHIYWASAGDGPTERSIGRADLDGDGVEQNFFPVGLHLQSVPYGIGLSADHLYIAAADNENHDYAFRVSLDGSEQEAIFTGNGGVGGVAVDSSHAYLVARGEEAIARLDLDLKNLDKQFIPLEGTAIGLAVDSAHLYWSNNGDSPPNPGNDLYRYSAEADAEGHHLADLTPLPDGNGAEVQGVLGASGDGSYVYFAANGVLAEGAQQGDCRGTLGTAKGHCGLYLWHEGEISLVGRLNPTPGEASDSVNWAATAREQFSTASYVPKTSFLSADGRTLLFRSREQLTGYENAGVPELYRFRVGEGIDCASCPPTGAAATAGELQLGRGTFPTIGPATSFTASVSSRFLSIDGNRVFFETPEALVAADVDGEDGCPVSGTGLRGTPSCNDVYEWEAPGAGTCTQGGPGYSPLNGGCLYLISFGKGDEPSILADASASGDDAFFFTREQLVGSDTDLLLDVYDARVDGGLAAQNPVPQPPCEGEACKPAATPPPPYSAPPDFSGPGNPAPKRCKPKKKCCKPKNGKHKRCGGKKHKHKPGKKKGSK